MVFGLPNCIRISRPIFRPPFLGRLQRLGWLDESHRDFAESLWRTASERVGTDGAVVDGCAGAGAGDSLRFYLDRAAEFGQDDRAGNLALWFAVKMERLRRGGDPK